MNVSLIVFSGVAGSFLRDEGYEGCQPLNVKAPAGRLVGSKGIAIENEIPK